MKNYGKSMWWIEEEPDIKEGESFRIRTEKSVLYAVAQMGSYVHMVDSDAKNLIKSGQCGKIVIEFGNRVRIVEKDKEGEISCYWYEKENDKTPLINNERTDERTL